METVSNKERRHRNCTASEQRGGRKTTKTTTSVLKLRVHHSDRSMIVCVFPFLNFFVFFFFLFFLLFFLSARACHTDK